jgi:hypothetical protein
MNVGCEILEESGYTLTHWQLQILGDKFFESIEIVMQKLSIGLPMLDARFGISFEVVID